MLVKNGMKETRRKAKPNVTIDVIERKKVKGKNTTSERVLETKCLENIYYWRTLIS